MFSISREDLFLGEPYCLKDICKIYQLTIEEIQDSIGLDKYQYFINLFTMEQEDLADLLKKKKIVMPGMENLTVFQYLMASAMLDNTFFLDFKQGLSTFIKEEILISPNNQIIIIGKPQDRRVMREEEFSEFALALRLFNRMRVKEPPPENETPMQRKFRLKREERERVKEQTAKKKSGEDSADFADIMSSLCVMNVGITALNIKNYTVYQIKDLLERAQAKETYYTELDMIMAGADSKKIKPKHYVRNLQKEVN